MKARYYFFIFIVLILTPIFFPKLIIVHYQNPEQPIVIYLEQYNKIVVRKELSNGSRLFILKRGYTMWANDFAHLGWYWISDRHKENRHEDFLSFLGEKNIKSSDLDLSVCRVHLYLDKDAKIIKRDVKYPVFLNLCI